MSLELRAKAKKGMSPEEIRALRKPKNYDDGRTKQAFKDQCDINKMLAKAQTAGSLSHLLKYPEPIYGEFDGEFDLLTAQERIEKATAIFADLPSEIRNEFQNDPLKFVKFAGNPENNANLKKLLPALAEPGSYFPNPFKRGGQGAGAATAPADHITQSDVPPPTDTADAGAPAGDGTDPGVSPPDHV